VIREALEVLHSEASRLVDLELTEAAGHLCGGACKFIWTGWWRRRPDHCRPGMWPGVGDPGGLCGLSGDSGR